MDKEEWGRVFPRGYRERVAPQFLGEVYASGKKAKEWAKVFINSREMGDFTEARELIPCMAAIDSMLLQDRAPDAINSISLEKLAKKGYAVQQGCRNVKKESDWRRPKTDNKNWKSKVDFILWQRLDPSRLGDDEQTFLNRDVEEEVRVEMDRDAQLLKARSKLEERATAGLGSGG